MQALRVLAQLRLFPPIDEIAQDGMTERRHVHPNLVGAAGLQVAANVGVAPVPGDGLPVCDSGLAPIGNGHPLPVGGMPPNGGVHSAPILFQIAADHGFIGPGQGVIL